MKTILIFLIAALLCSHAFSQGYMNNWVFGDSAGLNFNTEPPAYFYSSILEKRLPHPYQMQMVIYSSTQMEKRYGMQMMRLCLMASHF